MELGSFIHEEKSVKITGIKPGDWYVMSRFSEPFVALECESVSEDGHGVVASVPTLGFNRTFTSAWNCYKLDSDYTPDQLRALQERSIKEYFQYRRERQAGWGKDNVGTMDHLKENK
jgi:hypothetical protein